jgi:general secretion pathway protein D
LILIQGLALTVIRAIFVLFAVASTALAGGCSLPYEQLSLPSSNSGWQQKEVTGQLPAVKPGGSPASAAGDRFASGARVYEGSGQFLDKSGKSEQERGGSVAGPAGSRIAEGAAGDISINLVNANVAEVAKTILGDVLGVNYTVSDKAKATITLRTSNPVSREGLLEMLDTLLRSEDLALVVDGGLYRIIPASEALASGAPLRSRRSGAGGRDGVVSEIIPLRYVSAAEMERIVKSAAPKAAVLRADTARNLLLVSGNAGELQSMRELISLFDVDSMRGMSFGIFPMETSDADAIAQQLDTIFANDKESPTGGIVRFVPNRRLKSILVITSRPEYLKKAQSWIAKLEVASKETEKQAFVYRVQHRPAAELAQLIQKVFHSGQQAGSGLTEAAHITPPSANPIPEGIQGGGNAAQDFAITPPAIVPAGPVGSGPQPLAPSLQTGAQSAQTAEGKPAETADHAGPNAGVSPDERSNGISIVLDEPKNALVIMATAAEYRRISSILRTLDVAGNQVMIEATIAEVTLNDELKFGVRWFFEKGASKNISFTDALSGATSQVFPGFSYFMHFTDINVALRALSTVTDVNMVSTPTLMTVENKKAMLQIGDEVPVATQSAVTVQNPGAPIVNSVTFRDTGVILGITPRVADNGSVVLEIEQEVSDAKATSTSQIDSPTIQQRRVKTTVAVQDGQTILLAGFIQDKSTRTQDQVPLLGNIPYLGNAFKNKTDTITRTELLIAITPQVVRDQRQIDDVTTEYRDKLNFSTRPQRAAPPDRREQYDRLAR